MNFDFSLLYDFASGVQSVGTHNIRAITELLQDAEYSKLSLTIKQELFAILSCKENFDFSNLSFAYLYNMFCLDREKFIDVFLGTSKKINFIFKALYIGDAKDILEFDGNKVDGRDWRVPDDFSFNSENINAFINLLVYCYKAYESQPILLTDISHMNQLNIFSYLLKFRIYDPTHLCEFLLDQYDHNVISLYDNNRKSLKLICEYYKNDIEAYLSKPGMVGLDADPIYARMARLVGNFHHRTQEDTASKVQVIYNFHLLLQMLNCL